MRSSRAWACWGLPLLLIGLSLSCRPDLVVRIASEVYADGSLKRRLEIQGRRADGDLPKKDGWLADEAGVSLAAPDAWPDTVTKPGYLAAEGFFNSVEALPPLLQFRFGTGSTTAQVRTTLEKDERGVITRWVYHERHTDPHGASESARALDALLDLAAEALDSELRHEFGERFDTAPAEAWVRGELRDLMAEILAIRRLHPGLANHELRVTRWREALGRHGIDAAAADSPIDFWDTHVGVLMGWSRSRLSDVLSTDSAPLHPEDFGFLPDDPSTERAMAIVQRVWGGEEQLTELARDHVMALVGYYGNSDSPKLRVHARLRLPGELIHTNGTPDDGEVLWLFRGDDMIFGEVVLSAESVALNPDALRRLGARRSFSRPELLELVDLLFRRDPQRELSDLLDQAIRAGTIDLLVDEDFASETLMEPAIELSRLLDTDRR